MIWSKLKSFIDGLTEEQLKQPVIIIDPYGGILRNVSEAYILETDICGVDDTIIYKDDLLEEEIDVFNEYLEYSYLDAKVGQAILESD